MTRTALRGLFCAAALAMAAQAAHAEPNEDCDRPAVVIPGFIGDEPVDQPKMRYPRNALDDWSEGWVLLEFAVTAQGVPANITVVDAIGPKDFVKVAVEGVGRWRYKPATRNGVPVEQSFYSIDVQFLFTDSRKAADHQEFVSKYKRARDHIRNNRPDEAIAELELAFRTRLNLYEAAMGSFILAVAYAHKEDWERALYHARHANIDQGKYLEKAMVPHALALEIELNARTGNFREAVCGFERLRKVDATLAAPDSQLGKMIAGIDTAMKDKEPDRHRRPPRKTSAGGRRPGRLAPPPLALEILVRRSQRRREILPPRLRRHRARSRRRHRNLLERPHQSRPLHPPRRRRTRRDVQACGGVVAAKMR